MNRKWVIFSVVRDYVAIVPQKICRITIPQRQFEFPPRFWFMECDTRVSYDLVIFREEHQCHLLRREAWSSFEVSVGITEEGEVIVKPPYTSQTERDQKYRGAEKNERGFLDLEERFCGRIDQSNSNVKDKILATPSETSKVRGTPSRNVADLKARMKPRRAQAVAMTIQYGVRGMILAVQSEASSKITSPVLWVEIGDSSLTGFELVQETTDKITLTKTLRYVEEPVENTDRELKKVKMYQNGGS
ncbi:hypothetical protein Tco_0890755 [Tanacetum coccineum]|uniref:Uncharacterized protein n=1 Tax=Tanacetum coccineum TaxID=301880 RepID=A0ABQ5C476_9ASTR